MKTAIKIIVTVLLVVVIITLVIYTLAKKKEKDQLIINKKEDQLIIVGNDPDNKVTYSVLFTPKSKILNFKTDARTETVLQNNDTFFLTGDTLNLFNNIILKVQNSQKIMGTDNVEYYHFKSYVSSDVDTSAIDSGYYLRFKKDGLKLYKRF